MFLFVAAGAWCVSTAMPRFFEHNVGESDEFSGVQWNMGSVVCEANVENDMDRFTFSLNQEVLVVDWIKESCIDAGFLCKMRFWGDECPKNAHIVPVPSHLRGGFLFSFPACHKSVPVVMRP